MVKIKYTKNAINARMVRPIIDCMGFFFQAASIQKGLPYKGFLVVYTKHQDSPSLKHPILYIIGILITKANKSSMKVFRALYVIIRQGKWATDFSL